MPTKVTPTLGTALRQLEIERDLVDRQMGALRATLYSDSVPTKVSRRPRTMSGSGPPIYQPPHEGVLGETQDC